MPFSAPALSPLQPVRVKFSQIVFALSALLPALLAPAAAWAQTTPCSTTICNSSDVISTPDLIGPFTSGGTNPNNGNFGYAANIYPSTITFSGLSGTVSTVQVVLKSMDSKAGENSHGSDAYQSVAWTEIMLEGPGGQELEIFGQPGDEMDCSGTNTGSACGLKGLTITIADGNSPMPYLTAMPQNGTQNYEPSSYPGSGVEPYPTGPYPSGTNTPPHTTPSYAQTNGSSTLDTGTSPTAVFKNINPNGTWNLYMFDQAGDPVTINGWELILTLNSLASSTTTVSSNQNPSFTASPTNSVTFTATVTSSAGTPTGTVAFSANGTTISGCSAQALSGGSTTCNTTLSTQGTNQIQAVYSGNGTNIAGGSGTMSQLVEVHATNPSTDTYCNPTGITIPGESVPEPGQLAYPLVIGVPSSVTQSVGDLTLQLNNVLPSAADGIGQASFLLVAPDGKNLDFLDRGWTNAYSGGSTTVNLMFSDSGTTVPEDTQVSSNTYLATDDYSLATSFPTQSPSASSIDSGVPAIPGTIHYAQPFGNPTALNLEGAFSGAPAAGDWALYILNEGGSTGNFNIGSFCINFTLNSGLATTTTVTSSANPVLTGNQVTFTAAVKVGGSPVTSGTVTFTDASTETTLASGVSLNGSGVATFSTSTLSEGDHDITATYSGVSGTYDASTSSGPFWQRVNHPTTAAINNGVTSYCNPGGIRLPGPPPLNSSGAATPNPSNIFVANLPGTVKNVDLELDGFQTGGQADIISNTSSLLVGPGAASTNSLDFFSKTGNDTTVLASGDYVFMDGASEVPDTQYGPGGMFGPTSYGTADTFIASPSGYTPPGTFDYAAPHDPAFTFADVYGGTNPNGTWSLYLNQTVPDSADTTGGATRWCLNFTENAPVVAVTTAHSGNYTQGQSGAQFTVDIDNSGPGSTGDPTAGSNPMTVVDTLNSAFTYSSFSGTGWSCSAISQTVTCTNDSPVAESSEYPTLTIDVNVAANAGASITNQVSASGAGASGTLSNTDSITVVPSPFLGVTKTAIGTFTQGSTAEWDVVVFNTAPASATSGTVTVSDPLPSGYTVNGIVSGAAWNCTSSTQTSVICTSTTAVAGGSSFPTIDINVNVPAASPISVTNNVVAYGGGDLSHTNAGNGATSFSTVSVVQTPASFSISAGGTQSTPTTMAFGTPLAVTVKDAGGAVISGSINSVTFTAPLTGATGTFSNNSNTITVSTVAGVATAGIFTANGTAGGPYSVTVTDSPATPTSFSLTNTAGTATHFSVSAPTTVTAGVPFNVTVTALDASNNIATGYSGTVHFTTTDTGIGVTLPANGSLVNGTRTFSATLVTAVGQSVTATDTISSGLTATAPVNVIAGPAAAFRISTPPSTLVGAPFNFTVSAYDLYGNLATSYAGTVAFTSSDSGATLPAPVTFSLGASGTLSATLVTVGSQTITATDTTTPALTATSSGIQVNPPSNFVVTTPNDDNPAVATNCTPQTTPGTGTDADCSLRDALASVASAGGGNITFDSTKFAAANTTAQNTITLTYGLLVIPNKTTIQGLTTGSGATLTNLVTVSGNSTSPVFAVGSGKTASIANLTIANGNNLPFGYGAAINTTGNLTVTESTFSSNTATQGGAIYNTGTLVVNGSAFLGNSGKGGGGILNLGTARVTNCTFSRNNAGGASVDGGGDGVASEGGTMSVTGSTFAGNLGGVDVMDLGGTINVTNSILTEGTDNLSALLSATGTVNADHDLFVSGTYACSNCATNTSPVTASSASISGLGSYGGPTQTILPLPGSPAICAGTLANATAAGLTTDQRGLPFDPACSSGSVDSGAVQTNYALNFTAQEPSSVAASVAMAPAPIVTVTESGNPLTAGSASVSITDANSDLTTTPATASTSTSNGEATFSSLIFTSPTTDDTLTAALVLSTSPALSLTAASTSFDVTQIAPMLTFVPSPGTQTYGTAIAAGSLDATATASSNPVPGSFAYTTTISSVPNQPVVAGTTILPVGSYTIAATFTPTNTAEYSSKSTSASYSVTTATVTLTLPTASAITFGQTLASSTLSGGSALSGSTPVQGTFAFTTPTTAPPAGTQSESVTFTPTDMTNYSPVVSSVSVLVNKATPTLTLPTASAITFGQTLASSTLSGGSAISGSTPVAGMFTFTTPTTTPPAGTQSESVTFTPTNTTNYLPVVSAVSVLVNKATPTLTLPTASAITFGQTLASSTLSGGSAISGSTPVAGMFTFTTPTTTPPPGTQSESVTFTPSDTTNYSPVVSSVSVLVNKATPTLTLPTASAITFGQTLASSTLTGGSAIAGSTPVLGAFAFTTPTTAPPPGTQSESVTFTPTSTTDYSPVVSAVNVLVNKATPTVTWPTASAITYGQTLASSTLSGGSAISPITSAAIAGTFAFTSPTTAPHAGLQPESLTFTPANTTDYSIVTSTVNVLVNKATPVLTWHPASIELGFPLGAAQLDAAANVPGGFVYTPPSGTPVVTTTELLSVLFTPTDTVDYNTASLSAVPVTVTAGPLATLSSSTLSFGTVYLRTLTPKSVTLTNTGNAAMTINDPLLSIAKGGDSSEFVVLSLCPRTLAAGKSCTIFVTFVAGPFFNPQTATLSIMDNVPGSPQKVSLSAQVIDPLAVPSVINWNFGTQKVNTSSAPKAITLSNPGLTALTINSNGITISGGNSSDFSETNNCPASLSPKGSCTIDVTFKPTAKGLRSSSVVIIDNAFNNPQKISLSGTGN